MKVIVKERFAATQYSWDSYEWEFTGVMVIRSNSGISFPMFDFRSILFGMLQKLDDSDNEG